MRRVIAMAVATASLGGCSSFSLDYFKSTPTPIQVQLESNPPGADAHTSMGPSCKTPCSVSVPPPDQSFSVSYTLNKYQPATVQVQVMHNPGDLTTPATTTLDPSPVFAELQPMAPPPSPHKPRPRKPKVPKTATAPADQTQAPFPDPNAPPPAGH